MFERAKQWARAITTDVTALYIACRDPRTPRIAKIVAAAVVAYALSPIDLIPDFIPVIGYLDDLVLVPLGVVLAVRLIPAALLAEFRQMASQRERGRLSASRIGGAIVIAVWIVGISGVVWWIAQGFDCL
jgi:uncharacterized membrane protein YkvA (DUF1232 family)